MTIIGPSGIFGIIWYLLHGDILVIIYNLNVILNDKLSKLQKIYVAFHIMRPQVYFTSASIEYSHVMKLI